MTFVFKGSKIVKSYKKNSPIDLCSPRQIEEELKEAFRMAARNQTGIKSWGIKIMETLFIFTHGASAERARRESVASQAAVTKEPDDNCNITVDVSAKGPYKLLVTIGEDGTFLHPGKLKTKILFCEAVSYFIKSVNEAGVNQM